MIVVVRFIEPVVMYRPQEDFSRVAMLRSRLNLNFAQFFVRECFDEVTLRVDDEPTIERYPDGSRRGYLRFEGGPEYDLANVRDYTVIP